VASNYTFSFPLNSNSSRLLFTNEVAKPKGFPTHAHCSRCHSLYTLQLLLAFLPVRQVIFIFTSMSTSTVREFSLISLLTFPSFSPSFLNFRFFFSFTRSCLLPLNLHFLFFSFILVFIPSIFSALPLYYLLYFFSLSFPFFFNCLFFSFFFFISLFLHLRLCLLFVPFLLPLPYYPFLFLSV
jgi:hypothetical protein